MRVYRCAGCAQCLDKKLCTKSKRKPKLIKCYGNEANMREMAEKMESPEGQEVYRVRAKTVERLFGHVKQKIELAESQRIARDVLLRQLESVDKEVEYVQKRIAIVAKGDEVVIILMTIPGIDYYSAMIIKNEIGEIERFPGYKELCSFAGLVPRVHQSGNTRWEGHITKEGNALLRWILIQTVHQVVRYPGELRKFYLKLKKQKGTKIAVVATARKLLRIIYCMLNRKENYRYERKALTESKLKRLEKTAC